MNVLLIGSYGLGNVGDNTCQDVMLEFFNSRSDIVKCSHSPVRRGLIEWSDIVLLGGGGLLYDSGEVISLRKSNSDFCNRILRYLFLLPKIQKIVQYRFVRRILRLFPFVTTRTTTVADNYMSPIETAVKLGKVTAGIALGTQGITTEYSKNIYAKTLSKLDLLTVRDPMDKEVLESIGVSLKDGIEVCEDLGWLAKPPGKCAAEFDIGWVVRWLSDPVEEYRQPILDAIKALKEQRFTQRVVSFSRTDTNFLRKIAKEVDIPFFEDLLKDSSIVELAKCRMVVTNRFHASLFSLLLHRPVVLLSTRYSSKSEWLLQRAGLPYDFATSPELVASKVLEVWSGRELDSEYTGFVDKANKNLTLLNKLMQRCEYAK